MEQIKSNEELREDYLQMSLRMKYIQDTVLDEYFSTPAIVRFNYLEHLRQHTKKFSTLEQFKEFLEQEREMMKNVGRAFTKIERIEYRFLNKIYKDVILKQGQEFELGKKLEYKYDEQNIVVDPITFKEEEEEKEEE